MLLYVGLNVTPVWLVTTVVLITAAVFYLYSLMLRHLAKTTVKNKVVLITDSLSALGKECAKLFHTGGARLILCGNNWEKLEDLAEQLTDESDPTITFSPKLVELDFIDMESVPDVISEILECYGCLDILIFNSSLKVKAPVQNLSLEMDRTVMDVNYFGPMTLAKGVLPSLISRRTGHILLVNSIQGRLTVPFRANCLATGKTLMGMTALHSEGLCVFMSHQHMANAASKHAVQAFFDCLRAEVQQYGITVSTVNHTFIKSPSTEDETTRTSFIKQKSFGVNPKQIASEILKTLSSKKKEILMARSFSKAAIYTRSLFPNLFFAIMAAGVKDTTAVEWPDE